MGVSLSTTLAPIMELPRVEVILGSCLYRYGGGHKQDNPWVSIYVEVRDLDLGVVFIFEAVVENVNALWVPWRGQDTLPLVEWLLSKGLVFSIS